MSGIAGIIRFDGGPVEPGRIEAMTSAMSYRGPDGINHWVRGSVALGQCMLRTTPESLEETQPLTNEDESLVLVMDGWLSNWEELRTELLAKGARLRTRADAELVLRAYETWAQDCLHHIDGDFAFAIWDGRKRELFCARDRIGNKPFTYHWDGQILVFASEVSAILTVPWVRGVPNERIIAEFLAIDWRTRGETLWTDICRLNGAHSLRVCAGRIDLQRYWRPWICDYLGKLPQAELAARYRDILFDSVRRASRSHRPVAIEVSGGLDSSAVFAAAAHLQRRGQLPAPIFSGYGLAFPDDDAANEIDYIRDVANHVGCPVREVAPTQMPLDWFARRARASRQFPGYPNGAMSVGLRRAAAASGARVLLTGIGGDEWLGTHYAGAHFAEEVAQGNWREACHLLRQDASLIGWHETVVPLLRHSLSRFTPLPLKLLKRRLVRYASTSDWLSSELRAILQKRAEHDEAKVLPASARLGQRQQFRVLNNAFSDWARDLEECSSAELHAELRSPLNSRAVIEFAFATPERSRVSGATNKVLHRRAMTGYLPESVLHRQSKADFMVTFRRTLRQVAPATIAGMAMRRSHWLVTRDVEVCARAIESGTSNGAQEWCLWTALVCDLLFHDDHVSVRSCDRAPVIGGVCVRAA